MLKKIADLEIKKKLFLTVVFVFLLNATVLLVSSIAILLSVSGTKQILDNNLKIIESVESLDEFTMNAKLTVFSILGTKEMSKLDDLKSKFIAIENNLKIHLTEKIIVNKKNGEKQKIDNIKKSTEELFADYKEIISFLYDLKTREATELMYGNAEIKFINLDKNIEDYKLSKNKEISEKRKIIEKKTALFLYVIFAATVVIFWTLFFMYKGFLSSVVSSIVKAENILIDVAEGNFNQNFSKSEIKRNDEIGKMFKAIDKICKKMSDVSFVANKSSITLKDRIYKINNELSSLLNKTKFQNENFAKISSTLNENLNRAEFTDKVASNTLEKAKKAKLTMYETIYSIKNIETASNKIMDATTVITEISDQTNLLAINASIEAARAGEFGEGFAIVADEVKKLALKSSKSASDITSLIKESLSEVKKGVDNSRNSGIEIDEILSKIEEITNNLNHISKISKEQCVNVDENLKVATVNEKSIKKIKFSSNTLENESINLDEVIQNLNGNI